ncbi:DUF7344 domain-containing protein [Halorubrum sp. HHNYT27]|uniref:DUF7344 domain-containing protein n=1 Tax=Halorubrum sp. HHNYT27 TaxID=3402275 RepID=UPI003EB9A88A
MSGPDDGERSLTTDTCLMLLANAHRRGVLLSLCDRGAENAEQIPVEETVPDSLSTRTEVALTHQHLPKLAHHDVIRWDRENQTVGPGPAFGAIEPFVSSLDAVRKRLPDDWQSGLDR